MGKTQETHKVAFPRMGDYNYAIAYLIEHGLEQQYVWQPAMTKRTMEIGAKYSPDMVCTPFKVTLGSEIEALEAGADTLIMTMGLCRLGYYGELQDQILRDLGYHYRMVNLSEYANGKTTNYLKAMKIINPKFNAGKLAVALAEAMKMVEFLDEANELYYQNCGFETEKGACRRILDGFHTDMLSAKGLRDIEEGGLRMRKSFKEAPVEKTMPVRVGIIGEYYTVMDPFSNIEIEQKLADMGVEVHRWMNFTHRNIHYAGEKNLNVRIHDLCEYEMGPTSTANIWCARDYAERGFDGIVHVKSAGCTPEIDIMPVLQNISEDYKIPILYLTYDVQTSDTGLMTRLEAFVDMLDRRKRVLK